MTLTRNTGRTPGHSSRRVMAFKSNTLARAPPGAPGEAHQLCTLLGGQACRPHCSPGPQVRGRGPSLGPSPPHLCWAQALSRCPPTGFGICSRGQEHIHSLSSPSAPAPLVGTRQLTPHPDWTLEFREVLGKHSTSALRPPGLALGPAAWGPLSSNSRDRVTS